MSIYLTIFEAAQAIRHNKKCRWIYDWLEDLGVRICVSRFFNYLDAKKTAKSPTSQMEESKRFFSHHQKEVQENVKLLADNASKDVYTKMIQFRCTHKYSDLPYNSMRKQYFGNDFLKYREGQEVFVDCGAYDGDSIRLFRKKMKKCHIENYKIVAFEPDQVNLKSLQHHFPDALTIDACVWNQNDTLLFINDATGNSRIESINAVGQITKEHPSAIKMKAQSIDETPECKDASFIKMDIEGSEYNALLGAKKTIIRNKPKLAICIYHSDEDMIRIIRLIRDFVPEYKFYVRQHSNSIAETVLYATL